LLAKTVNRIFLEERKKSYEEKIFIAFRMQDYAKLDVAASEYQPCVMRLRLISPRTTKHTSEQSRVCALSTGVSEKSCAPTVTKSSLKLLQTKTFLVVEATEKQ
jgi:hypothetical protein